MGTPPLRVSPTTIVQYSVKDRFCQTYVIIATNVFAVYGVLVNVV